MSWNVLTVIRNCDVLSDKSRYMMLERNQLNDSARMIYRKRKFEFLGCYWILSTCQGSTRRRFSPSRFLPGDFTLWPLWCDTHVYPPFIQKNNTVYDSSERRVDVYSDAQVILRMIKESSKIKLGCASRTSAISVARQLLQALNWSDLFDYTEIYPGSKTAHFKRFHELSGIDYADMLFFDDETRNIHDISKLGVQCHLVEHGITLNLLKDALKKFQQQRRIHEYLN
ncbi:unnamed protein product [Schistosoma rodhaini]|uniref:Magnesium-dependent phosphatase 1 n=2 Tax=Schistosoma TaxID=6181 RepID=A0AA85G7Q1_9TREM|nr:unnamed protein product [Schistosoma rodhaini]